MIAFVSAVYSALSRHSPLASSASRVPHREPWQPSPYARLVGPVLLPEQPCERGLFIPDDERVRGDEEQAQVAKERQRSVEDRRSGQCKPRADVRSEEHTSELQS